MTVYADVLFIVNCVFNCLILALTAKCLTIRMRLWRMTAASVIGGAGAAALFCADAPAAVIALMRAALALIMIICAFGLHKRRTFVYFLIFILLAAILSGAVIFIISAVSGNVNSVIKNGIVYFDISGWVFLFVLLAAYPISYCMFGVLREKRARRIYEMSVTYMGRTVKTAALYDSGNLLKEPMTGKPVIVAEWNAVESLFPNVTLPELKKNAYERGLWRIPYHTADGADGMMTAFLTDNAVVSGKELGRIFIGISESRLSGSDEYRALVGPGII